MSGAYRLQPTHSGRWAVAMLVPRRWWWGLRWMPLRVFPTRGGARLYMRHLQEANNDKDN